MHATGITPWCLRGLVLVACVQGAWPLAADGHWHGYTYKPDGCLSQFVNNGQVKKRQRLLGDVLGSQVPAGTMPVGRLDEMSEGLLVLTTDGQLSHHLTSSRSVEKEYYAQVDGAVTDNAIDRLCRGMELSGRGADDDTFTTLPCQVTRLPDTPDLPERGRRIRDDRHGPTSWISVTLMEGKYRQVRKMTAAVGFPTLRLVRMRVGDLRLGDLQPGQLRTMNPRVVFWPWSPAPPSGLETSPLAKVGGVAAVGEPPVDPSRMVQRGDSEWFEEGSVFGDAQV